MSPSEQRRLAEDRMDNAKRQFTQAARAALAGDPQAPELAKAAYREVSDAQAALRALDSGGA